MQGFFQAPQSWDQYISRQFGGRLARWFEKCDTVVLAFDDYAHVPRAKGMTQAKRRKNVPDLKGFGERSALPCSVPVGEAWTSAICNRVFKAKVIELVVLRLPLLLLKGRPKKTLVIDYQTVEACTWGEQGVERKGVEGLAPMGEADVKFTRYADLYERLWVDSIDGDSVPIALVHHERQLGMGVCPPRMAIHRLELRVDGAVGEKRERGKKRSFEFVHVAGLYESLKTAVLQSVGRTHLPLHSGHEMRMLISLIGLTGTDFSRGLPRISGRCVFDLLPRVWMTLAMVYDPAADQLRVPECVDRLLALLYHLKFEKHAADFRGYRVVLAQIQGGSLSQKVKDSLPSAERAEATVRNVNWVLQYWRCEPSPPDPVLNGAQFGYRLERGVPCYADA